MAASSLRLIPRVRCSTPRAAAARKRCSLRRHQGMFLACIERHGRRPLQRQKHRILYTLANTLDSLKMACFIASVTRFQMPPGEAKRQKPSISRPGAGLCDHDQEERGPLCAAHCEPDSLGRCVLESLDLGRLASSRLACKAHF